MLSLQQLEKIMDVKSMLVQMQKVVMITINSVGTRLKATSRNYSFELFGYDFMVDSNQHLWLIEVNTNPSIEESGVILKTILPKMIDHLF